jgi:hypothetical protein
MRSIRAPARTMASMPARTRTVQLALIAVATAAVACSRAEVPATKDPAAVGSAPASPAAMTGAPATPPADPPAPGLAASANLGPPAGEIDKRFVADLEKAFADYKAWGRVDDELRWAPWLCRMPLPGRAQMSEADEGGHAQKLYSLFARDRGAYVSMGGVKPLAAKDGQIVVKESYLPEVVTNPDPSMSAHGLGHSGSDPLGGGDHFHPYATAGGKVYRASKLVGLYVVLEKPRSTAGTDEGFVYGTLTPRGEVTSAGRVGSCMGCHVQAKHHRLFGASGRH